MVLPHWSPKSPTYSAETVELLLSDKISQNPYVKFEEFIEKSNDFPIKFPVESVRCKTLKNHTNEDALEKHINSVYPVVHENVLQLYLDFMVYKRKYGSNVEKEFYKQITLKQFVNRLLRNRAVTFMGRFDKHQLLDGTVANGKWDTIGTNNEKPPLLLKKCISYDEVKLAAFLTVSSYTYFVNIGDRKNMAKFTSDRKNIEDEGVIVGMIGPRLVKENFMDFQELVINEKQNTEVNGYGLNAKHSLHKVFADVYEEECRSYNETLDYQKSLSKETEDRYTRVKNNYIFDNYAYYKRLTFSFDTLLLESNQRASDVQKSAYIHVVGLGLGVWKISKHQEKVYVDVLYSRIKKLGKRLSAISDICLSYINVKDCGGVKDGAKISIDGHPQQGIRVHILKRNPHEKLSGSNKGKLLVASYAWDGNALPGNEFWLGKLGSSGDSAAASSTQITEIHNPHINPLVCADNLKVVCEKGVIPFEDYRREVKSKYKKNKREPGNDEKESGTSSPTSRSKKQRTS